MAIQKNLFSLLLLLLLSVFAFYFIIQSAFGIILKAVFAILLLALTGVAIRKITNAEGWNGFVMVKLKEGFKLIEEMEKLVGENWDNLCDVGLVLSFGSLSYLMFKHIRREIFIISLFILIGYSLFILPYLAAITMMLIEVPPVSMEGTTNSLYPLFFAAIFLLGLGGIIILSLIGKAFEVLASIILTILGSAEALKASSPGVSFVIPGITLPLIEGIIAIIILMVVHEGGHGLSAKIARVRIKSTGILTLGWLPVGAFVDVDEKQLEKKGKDERARVAVAGSASNLITCFIFFIPTILLLSILPNFYYEKIVVIGVSQNVSMAGEINVGTTILKINDVPIKNLTEFQAAVSSLKENEDVKILTEKGEIKLKTNSEGKIGIFVAQPIKEEFWYVKFLFGVFGLTTVLNFLIGVVNLLPIPSFDGHRLIQIGIKNEKLVNLLTAIVLLSFFLNLLPWAWR